MNINKFLNFLLSFRDETGNILLTNLCSACYTNANGLCPGKVSEIFINGGSHETYLPAQ